MDRIRKVVVVPFEMEKALYNKRPQTQKSSASKAVTPKKVIVKKELKIQKSSNTSVKKTSDKVKKDNKKLKWSMIK